jgi:hypothetical protein
MLGFTHKFYHYTENSQWNPHFCGWRNWIRERLNHLPLITLMTAIFLGLQLQVLFLLKSGSQGIHTTHRHVYMLHNIKIHTHTQPHKYYKTLKREGFTKKSRVLASCKMTEDLVALDPHYTFCKNFYKNWVQLPPPDRSYAHQESPTTQLPQLSLTFMASYLHSTPPLYPPLLSCTWSF